MSSIAQNQELLKNLFALREAHRPIFKPKRVYLSGMALLVGENLTFARHTLTQVLMRLGLTEEDWSKGYRVFSQKWKNLPDGVILLARSAKNQLWTGG